MATQRLAGKFRFCPENRYAVLDVHRITPGESSGVYTPDNTVVVCANCHRAIHRGWLKMDRWSMSTTGRVLRVWRGEEDRLC